MDERENLWDLEQRSRRLQEMRADIRLVWDDAAATEVRLRYLDPHSLDDQSCRAALASQLQSLEEARRHGNEAAAIATAADRHGLEVEAIARQADEDIRTAHGYLRSADRAASETLKRFAAVEAKLRETGVCCGPHEGPAVDGRMFRLSAPMETRPPPPARRAAAQRQSTRRRLGRIRPALLGEKQRLRLKARNPQTFAWLRQRASGELRKNLIAAGLRPPPHAAAHHIVPFDHPAAAPARRVLERFRIDINDAANGVFLPARRHLPLRGAYHPTLHTSTYARSVNERLATAASRDEALDILARIRPGLSTNSFPF